MVRRSLYFLLFSLVVSLLFPQEVAITTATGDQIAAQVVAGDSCFFVVWEDHRAGVTNTNIYGQSVFPDGTVGGPGFPVCITPSSNQNDPVVAYRDDVDSFLVLWYDKRSGQEFYARSVLCDGDMGDEWLIGDATTNLSSPEIAFSGTNYLYTWMYRSGMEFETRYLVLDASGAASGAIQTLSGAGSKSPAVAFNGGVFLVVWEDSLSDGSGIYGRYFDSSGSPEGSAFILVDDEDASAPSICPAIGDGDDRFAVVWQHSDPSSGSDIYFGLVEPPSTDAITGVAICTADGNQSTPSVGCHEHGFLVAWEDLRSGFYTDIRGRFVGLSGSPSGDEFVICDADMGQQAPRLAFMPSAGKYLCVWVDRRAVAYSDIYGALLEPPPPSVGPTVTGVYPTFGTISGCDTTIMQISLSSEHGIDETTVLVSCNGVEYTADSSELWVEGMTIYLSIDYPIGAVETLSVCLEDVADDLGNHIDSSYCWSWIWDDEPPSVTSTNPVYGSVLSDMPATITASISDIVAGLDEATLGAEVNGTTFTLDDFGVYWDGFTMTLNLSEMGYSALPETNIVVFFGWDEALCPNEMSDTLIFYIESNPGPTASAQIPLPGEVTSCDDQQIQISITDDDGVDSTTVVLVVNGTSYYFPDHMEFSAMMLTFTPDPVFPEGTVSVELAAVSDLLGNPLSTPLSYDFIVDLTPPTLMSCTYPPWVVFDTTSTEDFTVVASDNYCDSLDMSVCYVMLMHSDGTFIIRWQSDSLVSVDEFSFSVPESWFMEVVSSAAETNPDTFRVCVRLADSPDRCGPNIADTCWSIIYQTAGVCEKPIPDEMDLVVFPNPFNAELLMRYDIDGTGEIEILDPSGRALVRYIVSGYGALVWDGCDGEGAQLPAGTYFVRMRAGGRMITRKVEMVR